MSEGRIDVVLRSYPVTTQTFHYQRLAELARLGVLGTVWVESAAEGHVDPELEALFADRVRFIGNLPAPSAATIARHAGLLREAATKAKPGNGEGGPAGAVKQTLSGIRLGEHLRSRNVADGESPSVIHAAFCTANLTIARAAAVVADLRYSTEVHSPLSWFRNPEWFSAKVGNAAVIAVISEYCGKRVVSLCPQVRDRVVEVHCGLPPRPELSSDMSDSVSTLSSIGGLVDKKGHDVFIRACALLNEPGQVIGGGELEDELQQLIDELGAPVEMVGALPHADVLDRIASSRVGVLAARHGRAGDEDGLPVVLLEFMRSGIPVCSTPVAGIPALLRTTGSLAVEGDGVALTAAIGNQNRMCGRAASPVRPAPQASLESYDAITEASKLTTALLGRTAETDRSNG